MEMKKIFLKSTLLLGSVFVLAACGSDEKAAEPAVEETTSVVESVSEEVVEETTEEEVAEETTEEETSEESTEEEVAEETTEEETSEESTEEETSEESTEEETSEESTEEETSEESTEEETSEESTEEDSEEAAGLVDGEYTAVSNVDENGWSILHVITVKDGKITESNFDYTNAEGDLKSEDDAYNKMMDEKAGVSAADAMKELNAALVDAQSADVDVVTGATSTSESFVKTTEALLAAAAEGNTDEINIDGASEEEATEGLVDGEYTAVSNEDENGWSILHVITVKDGEVTDSNFDYTNAEGDLKSEDDAYNEMMEEKAGVSAADAMKELNAALVDAQSADVDVVSGATSTSESFVKSAEALLAAAAEGNTDEINIDELGGALQDGEYTLTTEADERGWAHQFTLVVKDGAIAESNYDMVNEAGDLKSADKEYNENMEKGSGTSFATAVEALNAALVENQSVEDIEVVSGASSTSDAFLAYAQQLLAAAAEGNTDPIEADLVD